jgi:hypothetical protein
MASCRQRSPRRPVRRRRSRWAGRPTSRSRSPPRWRSGGGPRVPASTPVLAGTSPWLPSPGTRSGARRGGDPTPPRLASRAAPALRTAAAGPGRDRRAARDQQPHRAGLAAAAQDPAATPARAPRTPSPPDRSGVAPPLRRRRRDDRSAGGALRGGHVNSQTVAAECRHPSAAAWPSSQPSARPPGACPALCGRRIEHHPDRPALRSQPADRPPLAAARRCRLATARPAHPSQHTSTAQAIAPTEPASSST